MKKYVFIKSNDIIRVIVNNIYEIEENYHEYNFVININELKKNAILYTCYIISLYLTKNIKNLSCIAKNYFGILSRKNWKNKTYTKQYFCSYIFEEKPFDLSITNDNEEIMQTCMIRYDKLLDSDYYELLTTYTNNLFSKEIDDIEKDIIQMEQKYNDALMYISWCNNTLSHILKKDIINMISGYFLVEI